MMFVLRLMFVGLGLLLVLLLLARVIFAKRQFGGSGSHQYDMLRLLTRTGWLDEIDGEAMRAEAERLAKACIEEQVRVYNVLARRAEGRGKSEVN